MLLTCASPLPFFQFLPIICFRFSHVPPSIFLPPPFPWSFFFCFTVSFFIPFLSSRSSFLPSLLFPSYFSFSSISFFLLEYPLLPSLPFPYSLFSLSTALHHFYFFPRTFSHFPSSFSFLSSVLFPFTVSPLPLPSLISFLSPLSLSFLLVYLALLYFFRLFHFTFLFLSSVPLPFY